MKKLFIALLSFFAAATVTAQHLPKFSVVKFEERPFDTAANDERYKEVDGNGEAFSIVKLVSAVPDDDLRAYNFDFGLCEHRIKNINGEVWVYVQRNAMHVTIKRTGYSTLKYELNTTVQPGKVYEMVLSSEPKKVQKQMVCFSVSPADSQATIMYKREGSGADEALLGQVDADGQLAENLELGTYTYKVLSKNYHNSEGRITLSDIENTHVEEVFLRPKFARITLSADAGVEIIIDGENMGTGSWSGTLNAGNYNVECRKAGYRTGTQPIKVEEGKDESIKLKPLIPILGTLSLKSSPLGASISIDGKAYGNTPRNINSLLIGTHTVVISKEGYLSKTITVDIKENETEYQTVALDKKPENGSLLVTSSPKGATVTVGNLKYGETPYTVSNLLPGSYNVYVAKKGYQSDMQLVNVAAGETKKVNFSLVKEVKSSSSSTKSSYKSKSYKRSSYKYRSSKWKKYFNVGLTADIGGFPGDENEDMETAFSVAGGLLFRMGSAEKNWFNFITGAKYQYVMYGDIESSQITIPLNLNWNYLRGSSYSCYFGIGYEPGFEFYEGDTYYVDTINIQYFGFASRHHDVNAFIKVFGIYADMGDSSVVPVTMGVSYTYYF